MLNRLMARSIQPYAFWQDIASYPGTGFTECIPETTSESGYGTARTFTEAYGQISPHEGRLQSNQ